MDLAMAGVGSSYRLLPTSVLGLAWLQTHFETNTWELICSGAVRLQAACVEELCRDANQAGLAMFRIPAVELVSSPGS